MTTNNNGTKALMQKILIWALGIIIGLVGSLWAITWNSTDNKVDKACNDIVTIKEFIAKQDNINQTLEKRLDEILQEVKK